MTHWFDDIANYLACGVPPPNLTYHHKMKFFYDLKFYLCKEPVLFKHYKDGIYRHYLLEDEVISHCYDSPYGGHVSTSKTVAKVL